MKKKQRKFLKKKFTELKNAFSLVEIAVSLLVISIIIAALTPAISKRLTSSSPEKNRLSTECRSLCSDGYCAYCYPTRKICAIYTKECASNQYKDVEHCKCVNCTVHDAQCTKCTSKECLQCAPGFFKDSKTRKCVKCPKGYYCFQQGDGSVKRICAKGTVAPNEGMSSCISCKKSTSSQQGSVAPSEGMYECTKCADRNYAPDTTKACATCPTGHYCPQGKLIPCPKGYAQGSTGQTACVACKQSTATQQGSFAANTGMSSCTLCGSKTYAKNAAQTTACESCPQGRYCVQGKIALCPLGTAQPNYGQTACVNCLASSTTVGGTYASTEGRITCAQCGNGTYTTGAKQTACQSCPKGYACPNGRKTICGIGTAANGGASSCNPCTGATTSKAGSSVCVSCATGCNSCYETASNCTSCYGGYYKKNNTCPKCSPGYYCPGGTNGQSQCPTGSISNAGSTSCTSCGGGKTSVNNTCKPCAKGCTSCSGDINKCSNCSNGYYISGTACTECQAGYYCKNNKRTECPENNYCTKGATNPTPCPDNTTSPKGSKAQTDCEDEEWECEFKHRCSGYSVSRAYCSKTGNYNNTARGNKQASICIMDDLDKYFYDNGAETKNLTWTEITESNFASACNNPAKQNFAITIGGGCVGYNRTYRYSSKGDIYTDYASSCKITALTCGNGQAEWCQVAYWTNQCHCYKTGDSHYLVQGVSGQRIVKTIYSAQALPGLPFCNGDGTISYYSHYSGASSGCMTCSGCDCGDRFSYAALSSKKSYIVRKKK